MTNVYLHRHKVILPDESDILKYCEKTLDTSFRGGVLIPFDANLQPQQNREKFKFLDGAVATIPTVIYFRKNSHFSDPFKDTMRALISAGLIEHLMHSQGNPVKGKEEHNGPKLMTVNDLGGAFKLAAWGWFISTVVFLLEIARNLRYPVITE